MSTLIEKLEEIQLLLELQTPSYDRDRQEREARTELAAYKKEKRGSPYAQRKRIEQAAIQHAKGSTATYKTPSARKAQAHTALTLALDAAKGKWRKTGVRYTKDPLLNRPMTTGARKLGRPPWREGEPFIKHKRHPRGIKALESTSLAEQAEYIRSFLLDERRKGKASVGAAKARARVAKQENKARRLLKKGGRVKDIEVSKEFLKHSTERGEGSQGEGGKVSQTRDIVRQLKHTAHKHKKGQVAATSKHPRRIGSELVRKRSEIPPKDIVKTSTVTKPDRGQDIDVTKVHTDKPESHYSTKKMTSIVYKKDPKFMKPRGRREGGRDYRKRTRGHMAVTSFPGRTAPPAPQWAKSGHVSIEPRRQAEQLEYIKHFLEEGKLDKLTPEDHYDGYETDRVKRLKSSKEAWERIKKQMSDAKKAGKPVTYRVEGGTGKTHGNPVVRRAARMYAKKHRLDYKEKSLEHPRSDPADPQSDISKHVKKIRGKKEGEADRQAFLRGGNPPDTFPRDYGLPATPRSKSTDRFNRGRRLGMRKGLQTDVKKGRETVGTVGRDHIENPDYLKKGKSGKYVGERVK